MADSGDITVWINSPGGDCVAAAQIYNMLMDYKGNITVKIDGIAASAASVIAMAGTKVLVSPVSMMMIHNPATIAFGDMGDMQKAIDMLSEVKESIINAYEIKTGMSRAKLSHLMDAESWMNANKAVELGFADEIMSEVKESIINAYEIKTGMSRAKLSHLMDAESWMNANKAVELGFADEIMNRGENTENVEQPQISMMYSQVAVTNSLMDKISKKCLIQKKPPVPESTERSVDSLMERLDIIKQHI